jgi:hypothetical protein
MHRISRLRSGIVLGSKWVTRDLYENKMPIQEVADQIRGLPSMLVHLAVEVIAELTVTDLLIRARNS